MIAKKAIFGLLGAGTLTAVWFLLPKDSKIKKLISDTVCQFTDNLKERMVGGAKVSAGTNQNS
jgi:hypothetical protein